MPRIQTLIYRGLFFLLASGVSACSALDEPRQIAAYPLSTPYPQPGMTLDFDTYLDLEVTDVDDAAERAAQKAYQVGGALVEARSWRQSGRKHTTIVLTVPAAQSAELRLTLLDLGSPLQEYINSRATGDRPRGSWNTFVYFTVHFQPRQGPLPDFPRTSWQPLRTLARAWNVFLTIFGFLVDILIWLAVVLGPFILVGLFVWLAIRRYRSRFIKKM